MHPRARFLCLLLVAVYYVIPIDGRSDVDIGMLTRLDALEKQVSTQQHHINVQNDLIKDQHVEIASQKTTMEELQKTVVKQQAELTQQKTHFGDQERRIVQLEESLKMSKGNTTDFGKNLFNATSTFTDIKDQRKDLMPRLVLEGGVPVAFHAVNSRAESTHIGIKQKIEFNTVLLNLGNGFHNLHGIFIAPSPGLYIFSTSIMSWTGDHSEVQVALLKNGATLGRAYGHGDSGRHDQGSVTVVSQLATADEVYVSLLVPADASIYGGYFTSFMGCLLWPV